LCANEAGKGWDEPVCGLDGDFLVEELAALCKDEVAPLRLLAVCCAECTNEHALAVREEGVRELFLRTRMRDEVVDETKERTFVCHLVSAAGVSALRQYTL
jgi:hypothetical protein